MSGIIVALRTKLLGRCKDLRALDYPDFRALLLPGGSAHYRVIRTMATGLVFVPSRPFDLHPNLSAVQAFDKVMEEASGEVQIYDIIYNKIRNRPRGLRLCTSNDITGLGGILAQLQPLPPETEASIDIENKEEAYDEPVPEDSPDMSPIELPPELQPVLKESGLPPPPKDTSEIIVEPPTTSNLDAWDMKNLPDFDPDDSGEAEFYSTDTLCAWIRADQEACANRARPVLYEMFDTPRGPQSESCDAKPIFKSPAPILLIYQIPACKSDEDFRIMYQEYAYMTSLEGYQRVSCFRQREPSIPRWLVVQEFKTLLLDREYLDLKKQEAEYLWRKNGWEDVRVEFFNLRA